MEDFGPQSSSDNSYVKKYRLMQSEYRHSKGYPCGVGPTKNSTRKLGNMLADGELTGSNFISETAFLYSKLKVEEKKYKNRDLTIDEFRLFNNMLSSQPMCFNLFSDLKFSLLRDRAGTGRIVREMFSEISDISDVDFIDVEYLPQPKELYINDKTAFDAVIVYLDSENRKNLIAIETKYTDTLGSNSSADEALKQKIMAGSGVFSESYIDETVKKGSTQILRNFLLAYTFFRKQKFRHFYSIVISPEDDPHSDEEINEFRGNLLKYRDNVFRISLPLLVERALEAVSDQALRSVFLEFKNRYIA